MHEQIYTLTFDTRLERPSALVTSLHRLLEDIGADVPSFSVVVSVVVHPHAPVEPATLTDGEAD